MIQKVNNIACINKIPVWKIIFYLNMGASPDAVVNTFARKISIKHIEEAKQYWQDNKKEIECLVLAEGKDE